MFLPSARALLCAGAALATCPSPARASTEQVLYSFQGGLDGASPGAGLISIGGTLYGTTTTGGGTGCGGAGCGTVFALTPPAVAGGAWQESVLYRFQGGDDGANPAGHLSNMGGTLYGTTQYGGAADDGTVFALAPPASPGGAWTETVLHGLDGKPEGKQAVGGLSSFEGMLVGTARLGGNTGCGRQVGCGTVFALAPPAAAGGAWTQSTPHTFRFAQGAIPPGGLVGMGGSLYGTTSEGGGAYCTSSGGPGCGTVFSLTPPKQAGRPWLYTVLHVFTGPDGSDPSGGLIHDGTTLYGETASGGASEWGAVVALSPAQGGGWTESVLHSFALSDPAGVQPYGHPTLDAGVLYGTTSGGGAGSAGAVFALAPPTPPGGAWTETVLHAFAGSPDGAEPLADVIVIGGTVYGTTNLGGAGYGTVFAITP